MRIRSILGILAIFAVIVAAPAPTVAGEHRMSAVRGIPAGGLRASKGTGNTIGTTIYEKNPRADGYRHIDTPATIANLKAMGLTLSFTTYGFPRKTGTTCARSSRQPRSPHT